MARPLLLFDGVCNLCDRAVQFVIRRDGAEQFQFASLQSAAARPHLNRVGLNPDYLSSLVLIDEKGRAHVGSDAVLEVGRRLDPPWPALSALGRAVPRSLREAAYQRAAENRYRMFGRRTECRLPTRAERARFLDAV